MDDAKLVVMGGPDEGQDISLSERVMVIGSARINDIVVDRPHVSRRHASIRRDYRGSWLTDMGSRRGTFVNGKRLGDEPRRLRDTDRLEFGEVGGPLNWVFVQSPTAEEGLGEPDVAPEWAYDGGVQTAPEDIEEPTPGPEAATLIPLPRNVLLALFGALLGGEFVIIVLVIVLLLR
jgi:predicted component of type VI protein secretion system